MILSDAVRNLVVKMDVFMTKKGKDLPVRTELIRAINDITGEDSLDAIYVNETDNFRIPDVVVMPLYHNTFNQFLMDADVVNTCPFGYTVEIHQRCFTEFTPEELSAVVIHDILQNVQSCTAKIRFMKAYNHALSDYPVDSVLDMFDDISSSEIAFMGFADICSRPYHVPVVQYDYLGTDEVLRTMKLAEAYESYLDKSRYETSRWVNRDNSVASPEAIIATETRNDYRTMRTILVACMDKDIRHYYTMVRNAIPLVSLEHVFGSSSSSIGLGFVSRKRKFKSKSVPQNDTHPTVMVESFLGPKSELELRFQVDKIITEMRYMESEAEREVILFKIKNTAMSIQKQLNQQRAKLERDPTNKPLRQKLEYLQNLIDELDMLRKTTVSTSVKQKRYGIFVSWPEGYEDPGPILDDTLYQL